MIKLGENALFNKKEIRKGKKNMKSTTRNTILSILLTLLIVFSAFSPVLAQSQTAEQTISETSTSFSKLYEEVN
ncbi:MAG TPA: hypothetical protein PLD39_06280, partial [Flexilinea sp.]|nr:hypothetical protein [Flexilinea sp.]